MSSIAEGRPKRATAGNRMAKLITGEETEKDEFYETAYGGFKETEGDKEYEEDKNAAPEDDTVDSDFDKEEEDAAAVPKTNGNGTAKTEKRPSETGATDAAAEEPAAKKVKEADGENEEETPVTLIETVEEPVPTNEEESAPKDQEDAATKTAEVEGGEEKVEVEQPSADAVPEPAE